jgi:hypothetical protein
MDKRNQIERNTLIIQYTTHIDTFNNIDQALISEKINKAIQLFTNEVLSITLNGAVIYAKAK